VHVLFGMHTLISANRISRLLVEVIGLAGGELWQRLQISISSGAELRHVHLLDIFRIASQSFLLLLLLLQLGYELAFDILVSLPQLRVQSRFEGHGTAFVEERWFLHISSISIRSKLLRRVIIN